MSYQIDELILAAICVSPFLLIGALAAYVVLSGEMCDEGEAE